MAITIRKTQYRAWPVSVKQPVCDDNGVVTEAVATFVAHFAAFTEAEFEASIAEAERSFPTQDKVAPAADAEVSTEPPKEAVPPPLSLSLLRNAHVFRSLIAGWGREVKDEAGVSIPFSSDALTSLVTGPDGVAVSAGINRAMFELRFGVAPAKNSPASPEPGAAPGADGATQASAS